MSAAIADSATSKTTETFLTALVSNSLLLGIEIFAFVNLKNRLRRIYTPRTYLPPPDKRAQPLPNGPWRWLPAVAATPANEVIHKNGLDAYLFLRFLRLMIIIFGSFTLVTWTVLLPVNFVGFIGNDTGLNQLGWGNIPDEDYKRYAAHLIVVYVLTFWVIYLIRLEYIHYTHIRQDFLASKSHSRLPQARTVLITSIPHHMCSEKELRIWGSFIPGGIQKIWIYRDTRELNKAYDERSKACVELESAVSKLLRLAVKERRRKREMYYAEELYRFMQRPGHVHDTETRVPSGARGFSNRSQRLNQRIALDDLVPQDKRPTHRLGCLGLWGPKVDSFKHYKHEISRLNAKIDFERQKMNDASPLGSAFIQCHLQMGAHVLAQCVSYHEPLKMSYKWIQVSPKDVIWENIDDGAYETRLRYVTSWMASIGIIVLWFFPVTFVGLLSNINQLCVQVRWLSWLCKAPTPVPGILQGVLSPLILAIVFVVLPWILRGLAWYENIPLYSLLSISVYKRFFPFLVIHGFLVVTLSSGVTSTASDIINAPAKTVSDIALHLPEASVFFLTWTVTQGLTGAGAALLQVVTLFLYYMRKWFFGHTPRQAYSVTFLMPSADFGTEFSQMSLLATIGFSYSILSPIINGLATIAFVLFYLAWKFLLNWVLDQPVEQETGGLYYPVAMQSLFVGLYIEQICLAALFFLKSHNNRFFLGLGVLMLILLVITIGAQIFLRNAFKRSPRTYCTTSAALSEYLPMSLATKQMQARAERQKRRREGRVEEKDTEPDIFHRKRIQSVAQRRITKLPSPQRFNFKPEPSLRMPSMFYSVPMPEASGSRFPPVDDRSFPQDAQSHLPLPGESRDSDSSLSPPSPPPLAGNGNGHPPTRLPSMPMVLSPAPMLSSTDASQSYTNTYDEDSDSDFDEAGFDHPSTYMDQQWIWVPKDEIGLSQGLVEELRKGGVDASDEGAYMEPWGTVEVTRNPPDEAWVGAGVRDA